MREINLIVVHCSATRADRDFTENDLEVCHRHRGFNGAGYHFYIRKNGDIKNTRPLEKPGDPQLSGQCTGTYRVLGTAQPGQDAFSALCCVHLLSGSPSVFRRCCPYCSKTGRNVQAAYFFNRKMVA